MNGALPAVLTTIQQRYLLTSTQCGIIVAAYDFAMASVIIFVSYYGSRGRKPRWVGLGTILMGIGCLVYTIPQIAFGTYSYATLTEPLCYVVSDSTSNQSALNSTTNQCNDDMALSNAFWFFLVAQVLCGVGAAPLYTVGITYIDENVKPSRSPLLIGVFMTMSIGGPAIGYVVAGACLRIYVDLQVPDASMTVNSPLWIGA